MYVIRQVREPGLALALTRIIVNNPRIAGMVMGDQAADRLYHHRYSHNERRRYPLPGI